MVFKGMLLPATDPEDKKRKEKKAFRKFKETANYNLFKSDTLICAD